MAKNVIPEVKDLGPTLDEEAWRSLDIRVRAVAQETAKRERVDEHSRFKWSTWLTLGVSVLTLLSGVWLHFQAAEIQKAAVAVQEKQTAVQDKLADLKRLEIDSASINLPLKDIIVAMSTIIGASDTQSSEAITAKGVFWSSQALIVASPRAKALTESKAAIEEFAEILIGDYAKLSNNILTGEIKNVLLVKLKSATEAISRERQNLQ